MQIRVQNFLQAPRVEDESVQSKKIPIAGTSNRHRACLGEAMSRSISSGRTPMQYFFVWMFTDSVTVTSVILSIYMSCYLSIFLSIYLYLLCVQVWHMAYAGCAASISSYIFFTYLFLLLYFILKNFNTFSLFCNSYCNNFLF